MHGSLGSALEMLAALPYSMSIETVFVIGGGQIYREALYARNCDAIHIENAFGCDTFITLIDASVFRPWILFQMEWRREIGQELALVKIWLSDFNPRELLCRDAVQSAKNLPTSHNKEILLAKLSCPRGFYAVKNAPGTCSQLRLHALY